MSLSKNRLKFHIFFIIFIIYILLEGVNTNVIAIEKANNEYKVITKKEFEENAPYKNMFFTTQNDILQNYMYVTQWNNNVIMIKLPDLNWKIDNSTRHLDIMNVEFGDLNHDGILDMAVSLTKDLENVYLFIVDGSNYSLIIPPYIHDKVDESLGVQYKFGVLYNLYLKNNDEIAIVSNEFSISNRYKYSHKELFEIYNNCTSIAISWSEFQRYRSKGESIGYAKNLGSSYFHIVHNDSKDYLEINEYIYFKDLPINCISIGKIKTTVLFDLENHYFIEKVEFQR